jgi:hypothetical protein
MPMKKFFTPSITNEESNKEKKMAKYIFGPREETLGLIRQFARIYRVESKLEQELCSYMLN